MSGPVQIIGGYLSPYVRKVLVFLDQKGLAYELDPIVPFMGDDRFSQVSPLRRIPVFTDDQITLTDSSVICQYLEERYPDPPLYPHHLTDRARARWLEEFADSRLGEVLIWGLFSEVIINPFVWGRPTNEERVQKTLTEDLPHALDYLESQAPADGYLFESLSIADISIACFFRNAAFARYRIDATRWPRTAALVDRVLRLDSFVKLKPFEKALMSNPPAQHREALADLGAPLMQETYGTTAPRPGIMRI